MSMRVTSDVWEHSQQEGTDLLVLLKIADYADEHRIAWPSVAHLATRCRVSARTVQYALRRLLESGELAIHTPATPRFPTRYRVLGGVQNLHPWGAAHCTPGVQPIAPNTSVDTKTTTPLPPAGVQAVWDAWLESTGKARSVLDPKRRALIRRQLRAFPVEDLVDAVRGWKLSPYHRGENARGTVYNDIELLLRDAEHVERFRDLQRGVDGRKLDPTERLIAEIHEAKRQAGL